MQDSDWLTVNTILALLYCSAFVFSIWIRSNRVDVALTSLIAFAAIYIAEDAMLGTILGFIIGVCIFLIAFLFYLSKNNKLHLYREVRTDFSCGLIGGVGLLCTLLSNDFGLNVLFETLVGPHFFDVMYHAVLFVIIALWASKIAEIGSYLVWVPVTGLLFLELVFGVDALISGFVLDGRSSEFAKTYSYFSTGFHLITIFAIWSYHNGDSKDRDHDIDNRSDGKSVS